MLSSESALIFGSVCTYRACPYNISVHTLLNPLFVYLRKSVICKVLLLDIVHNLCDNFVVMPWLSLTSAAWFCYPTAGVLSLLDEPDPQLQVHALELLDNLVDDFWAEISDYIAKMYVCCCKLNFTRPKL